MFYAASGMNVSQSCTDAGHLYPRLAPHLLGLISIFNGKPLKIEEKIMFCCSRAVFPKTPEGTGALDARYPCRRDDKLWHNCKHYSVRRLGIPDE